MNEKPKQIIYGLITAAILVWMVGYEFFWRYDNGLDMTQRLRVRTHSGAVRELIVKERSTTTVDTVRRTFTDMKNGKTYCSIWLDGGRDTIHTEATGRYFSELRPLIIAADSSTQVILIPNSEHDLPTGWGIMIYLTPTDSLRQIQIINSNIADMNRDGTFELFDKSQGKWTKLDPETGNWVATTINKTQP